MRCCWTLGLLGLLAGLGGSGRGRAAAFSTARVSAPTEVLASVTRVAKDAARQAGVHFREAMGTARAEVKKTKNTNQDLLTQIDPECQAIITDIVTEAFPDHAFLGEEDVAPGPDASRAALQAALKKSDWVWVVDPIDGTTNFVHAFPLSAVSIGVCYKGEVVAAAIYDPAADEMFWAERGTGAFLNDTPMMVGSQENLIEALVCAGSPPNTGPMRASMRGVCMLAAKSRSVRMLGSAAIMLAWVACGRLTAYFEPDLNSWDTAAGALLVEEAGGMGTGHDRDGPGDAGAPYTVASRAILFTNGKIHEEMRAELAKVQALSVLPEDVDNVTTISV